MPGRNFGFRVSPLPGNASPAATAIALTAADVANSAPINVAVARVSGGTPPYTLTNTASSRFAIQSDGIIRRTATALGAGPHTIAVNGTDVALTVLSAGELVTLGSTSLKGPNAAKRQAVVAHIGDSTVKSGIFAIDEYTRRWDGKTLVWYRNVSPPDNGLYAAVEPLEGPGTTGAEASTYTGPLNEMWRTYRRIAPTYVHDSDVEYVMYQYSAPGSGFSTALSTPGNWNVTTGDRWGLAQNRLDTCLSTVANSYLDTVVISLGSNDAHDGSVKLAAWDPGAGGVSYPVAQFITDMTDLINAIRTKYGSQVKIVLSNIAPAFVTSTADPDFETALAEFQDSIGFCWAADLRDPTTASSTGVHYDDQDDQNELAIRLATAARLAELNSLSGGASVPDAPVLTLTPGQLQMEITALVPANNNGRILYYELQWSANGTSGWTTLPGFVRKPSVSGPRFVHTGLTASTTYHYRARAINIAGASAWSSVANAATPAGFDASAGLVNFLKVNSGGTTVTDTVGGATVTISNLVYDVDAGAPNGYVWTSSVATRQLNFPITPTNSFTYAAWVNPSAINVVGGIFSEGVTSGTDPTIAHMYLQSSNGRIRAGVTGNVTVVTDTAALVAGTWAHMVLTYDDTTKVIALHRDGVETFTQTLTGNVRNTTATRVITGYSSSNSNVTTNAFRGSIGSLRRYNKALSASEVAALYALGRAVG